MSGKKNGFVMEDYARKREFASFLPGIAGIRGIPIWCYYVNRGQGVVSFGSQDKDHAIMEFYPAHTAYQVAATHGFRTFLRVNGTYVEPFSRAERGARMEIEMNALSLEERDEENGIRTRVIYFILPEEPIGGLVRRVEIENIGGTSVELEALDGMPALIPYGVDMKALKEMAETSKAWMQTELLEDGTPVYAVRASMEDSAEVSEVNSVNFASALSAAGEKLRAVYDPEVIFSYDKSFGRAVRFAEGGLSAVTDAAQNHSNEVPCAFFAQSGTLPTGGRLEFYEFFGQANSREVLSEFLGKKRTPSYFEGKLERSRGLVDELTSVIGTRTADHRFDAYCRYTYMDNVLRGGFPIRLGHNKIFYVYSRKHGDLERDYNYFSMLPEYYSQGNGNYRDVNQNRRCDTYFTPFVGRENIRTFYSLIQPDGYNPLGVEQKTYTIPREKLLALLAEADGEARERILGVAGQPFSPGRLSAAAGADETLFLSIMDFAEEEPVGDFKEGYWTDHWTYNLDLIEDYLAVFPEDERELLFASDYTFFAPQVRLLPRAKRYEKTKKGIRQYHFLDEEGEKAADRTLRDQSGEVIRVTLLEKLLLLCALKFATIDPYGMGVEMEGGKPGWYDALNGLPGMLGSSMAETYELQRMLRYVTESLGRYGGQIRLSRELWTLMEELGRIAGEETSAVQQAQGSVMSLWNRVNDAKEAYRARVYAGPSGESEEVDSERIRTILECFSGIIGRGIEKARAMGGDVVPTYFAYEVKEYTEDADGIHPTAVEVRSMPLFLEGPVRYLKLDETPETKRGLYRAVRDSALYDDKLSMYKVNAALEQASIEIGRCRSFTPGWLENESVWLHMEYKYLLELLRSGLYEEFAQDFRTAGIPFLDETIYGRSTLENSSFIASSANPNSAIHGKGFVARLSGSTVEFLSMWRLMFFGARPFSVDENGELAAEFAPALPEYLIPEEGVVCATMLGSVRVSYQFPERRNYFPGTYRTASIELTDKAGKTRVCEQDRLRGEEARRLRAGEYTEVKVVFS